MLADVNCAPALYLVGSWLWLLQLQSPHLLLRVLLVRVVHLQSHQTPQAAQTLSFWVRSILLRLLLQLLVLLLRLLRQLQDAAALSLTTVQQ